LNIGSLSVLALPMRDGGLQAVEIAVAIATAQAPPNPFEEVGRAGGAAPRLLDASGAAHEMQGIAAALSHSSPAQRTA
jgi:hypothetical protein